MTNFKERARSEFYQERRIAETGVKLYDNSLQPNTKKSISD